MHESFRSDALHSFWSPPSPQLLSLPPLATKQDQIQNLPFFIILKPWHSSRQSRHLPHRPSSRTPLWRRVFAIPHYQPPRKWHCRTCRIQFVSLSAPPSSVQHAHSSSRQMQTLPSLNSAVNNPLISASSMDVTCKIARRLKTVYHLPPMPYVKTIYGSQPVCHPSNFLTSHIISLVHWLCCVVWQSLCAVVDVQRRKRE